MDELFRRFFGFAPSDRYYGMLNPDERPQEGHPKAPNPLPVSPKALQDALRGLATFETIQGPGPYPVRVLVAARHGWRTGDQCGASGHIVRKYE